MDQFMQERRVISVSSTGRIGPDETGPFGHHDLVERGDEASPVATFLDMGAHGGHETVSTFDGVETHLTGF
ncbi:hypothetical protein D3C86_2091160 [compost metagenome]